MSLSSLSISIPNPYIYITKKGKKYNKTTNFFFQKIHFFLCFSQCFAMYINS